LQKLRIILGFLFTLIIAIFGVFLFSNLKYHGITLSFIFQNQFGQQLFFEGMYSLWASGFMCDWWYHFSVENIQNIGLYHILDNEVVLPALLTWLAAGFVGGVFMRRPKYGLYMSMGVFIFWTVFLIIFMILAGADLTQMVTVDFYATTGKLMTGLIFINVGGLLGGLVANHDFS
jgi:hypothetical protein